jgi:hypothetical protein
MFAGLPGTGIGGLFYVLLVLLMVGKELYRSIVRGQGVSLRFAMFQAAIVVGIIGALWLEAVAVEHGMTLLQRTLPNVAATLWHSPSAYGAIVPTFAAVPFVILVSLWAVIRTAALIFHPRPTTAVLPPVEAVERQSAA